MTRRAALAPVAVLLAGALAACSGGDGDAAADARPTTTAAPTTAPSTTSATPTTTAPTTTAPDCSPTGRLQDATATLVSGGVTRSYQVAVPDDLDPDRPTPVILDFHGSGSNMAQQAFYSQLPERGAARGYVVVTPDGTGTPQGWALGGGADDAFVADLLTTLSAGMCVDPGRVFAAGISNGSAYSALAACRPPYRYAAIGLVAATVGPGACPPQVRPTVVAFHGTDDRVVPYGGGAVDAEGGRGLAAPDAEGAVAAWAAHDGCSTRPEERTVGADVVVRAWTGCAGGASVTFHRVEGGGHTWPGAVDLAALGIDRLGATTQSVSATDVLLDVFDRAPDRAW